jgi:hypothetical protein
MATIEEQLVSKESLGRKIEGYARGERTNTFALIRCEQAQEHLVSLGRTATVRFEREGSRNALLLFTVTEGDKVGRFQRGSRDFMRMNGHEFNRAVVLALSRA